ncbi:DUF2125 domain-containing protein [Octadecabacter sp. 1_MG-2023]|uniref:DUF2125 domain-containing protein n=1 Tax=unclassified Octadecabacter TaxID=196158 RepID=UPI001C09C451|nr:MULTISPECIES: DUF2125 domain-containing protein [unclassified Octadecabacter]MBU2991903.1 DUF2125 domain-containing protein [Octadecabacter sp. B2R22]MDO6735877.1 DUF2125 domain-containing protein [Octadecabacter sp. 1_MG-2023]
MRKLIVAVVVLALLYGGYWFVGKSQIQTRLAEALVEIDAGPMDIDYSSLKTRGFPSRFDTTLTDLVIDSSDAAVRWETPIFQLLALSYQPNNVRAYFPQEQVFIIDGERLTLFTDEMVARGQVSPNASLPFEQAELELLNPRLQSEEGAELTLARLFAAMRLTPETTQTYDAYIEARAIVLPDALRQLLDPGNAQPAVIESLRLDSDVELSAPLQLNGASETPPRIDMLSIHEFAFEWGEMSLSAIGDVVPDQAGLLNGSITLSARNWQTVLDLAVIAGAIPDEQRQFYEGIIDSLDETPHISDTLTTTLMITDGQMSLGPLPLGPAPRLR